jgi:hypothetical protein
VNSRIVVNDELDVWKSSAVPTLRLSQHLPRERERERERERRDTNDFSDPVKVVRANSLVGWLNGDKRTF